MSAYALQRQVLTAWVPSWRLSTVYGSLLKTNRRLNRKRIPQIQIEELSTKLEKRPHHFTSVELTELRITFVTYEVAGWKFVAKAERLPLSNETLVSVAPEFQGEDLGERQWPMECGHCNHKRHRKTVYLLRNEEGGEIQVGSTCLKEFLGVDPSKALSLWETIETLRDEFTEEEDNLGGKHYDSLLKYLTFVAMAIRLFGWLPKSKATFGTQPTANVAFSLQHEPGEKPEEEDEKRALEAIEWAQNLPRDGSDYERNAGALARCGILPEGKHGLGASIVGVYLANQAKEAEAQERKESTYWGTVGKRDNKAPFVGKVLSIREFASDWGLRTLLRFANADGQILVWWKSGCSDLEPGDEVTFVATVKAHEVYKDIKQTVVQRATFK